MSHRATILLWVMGHIQELVDAGLAKPMPMDLGPKGISEFDQLVASGFRPTDEEAKGALGYLKTIGQFDLTPAGLAAAEKLR